MPTDMQRYLREGEIREYKKLEAELFNTPHIVGSVKTIEGKLKKDNNKMLAYYNLAACRALLEDAKLYLQSYRNASMREGFTGTAHHAGIIKTIDAIATELAGTKESDMAKFDYIAIEHSQRKFKDRDSCFFWGPMNNCKISRVNCRYGLTEIKVPKNCPLRKGNICISLVTTEAPNDP